MIKCPKCNRQYHRDEIMNELRETIRSEMIKRAPCRYCQKGELYRQTNRKENNMKKRRRPQLKLHQLMKFLRKFPPNSKLTCAPSMLNIDEIQSKQEFIDHTRALKLVSIEVGRNEITFGYIEEE